VQRVQLNKTSQQHRFSRTETFLIH